MKKSSAIQSLANSHSYEESCAAKIITKGASSAILGGTGWSFGFPTQYLLLINTNSSYCTLHVPHWTAATLLSICFVFVFCFILTELTGEEDTVHNQIPRKLVHRITERFGLEGTLKMILFQPPGIVLSWESFNYYNSERISNSPKLSQKTLFNYFDS